MHTLLLLRHAYSEFHDGISDFNRIIDEKNSTDAFKMLIEKHSDLLKKIDYVICSSAIRAVQTMEHIFSLLTENLPIHYSKDLYNKRLDKSVIWQMINKIDSSVKMPLIIAHNPVLTHFFNDLPTLQYEQIHFPALGIAKIQYYDQPWNILNKESVYSKVLLT